MTCAAQEGETTQGVEEIAMTVREAGGGSGRATAGRHGMAGAGGRLDAPALAARWSEVEARRSALAR
jgi:hypothetical protein